MFQESKPKQASPKNRIALAQQEKEKNNVEASFVGYNGVVTFKLASLIDKMINFESFVGEEYLTVLQLKTLELVAKESEIDLTGAKKILEWIIEDEERHEIIMARIKTIIQEKNQNP